MAKHLFVTYSLRDWWLAESFVAKCVSCGIPSWHQAGEDFGTPWRRVIYEALTRSEAVVVLGTRNATKALWVAREVAWAQQIGIPVVVIEFDGANWPGYATARVIGSSELVPDPCEVLPREVVEELRVSRPNLLVPRRNRVGELEVELLRAFRSEMEVRCLDWSFAGIAVGGREGGVEVWSELGDPVWRERVHSDWVWRVIWSRRGDRLATVGNDGRLAVLSPIADANTRNALLQHQDWIWGASWGTDDDQVFVCGYEGSLQSAWFQDRGSARVATLIEGEDWLWSCSCSPSGNELAVAGVDGVVKALDVADGHVLTSFFGHSGGVFDLDWSSNGRRIASAGHDSTVRIWELGGSFARQVLSGHTGWVNAVRWNPRGDLLASSSSDGTARVWNAGIDRPLLSCLPITGRPTGVAWSPSGDFLAVSHGRSVSLFEVVRKA